MFGVSSAERVLAGCRYHKLQLPDVNGNEKTKKLPNKFLVNMEIIGEYVERGDQVHAVQQTGLKFKLHVDKLSAIHR